VAQQQFNGSFSLSAALCSTVGVAMDAAKQLAVSLRVSEDAVATALAIAFFEGKLAHMQDDWQLVAAKVRHMYLVTTPTFSHIGACVTGRRASGSARTFLQAPRCRT
jgi:hypothetical protein